MRNITKVFLRGLAVIVPILAAVYVLWWFVDAGETLFRSTFLLVLPDDYYIRGMGLPAVILVVFFIGLLMYPWLTRRLLDLLDAALRRVPLFGMVYSPTRDLMDIMQGDVKGLGQTVLIEIPGTKILTLGFITRNDLSDLPDGLNKDDHVVVYVQWSSQIGGYCFVVPRDAVRPVAMTVDQGMKWALTAGVSAPTVPRDEADESTSRSGDEGDTDCGSTRPPEPERH